MVLAFACRMGIAQPNLLIIMADDMGYSDIGCYGGEIDTPNLDTLAANGLRFTQFHNAARCCPTRASLLTGRYQHTVGLKQNGNSLSRQSATIAEALKEAGYQTAMAGKWHLSETLRHPDADKHQAWVDHHIDHGPFGPPETYPTQRGFDRFYGVIWGVIDYFDPFSLVEDGQPVRDVPDDYYFTDAITDKAIEYIEDFANNDAPFFLYYAHCAPHWPLHAREQDIAKYRDTYRDGWNALRKKRYQRQLDLGLFNADTAPLPELIDNGEHWDALSEERRAYEARKMAVHAAMVDRVDQGVGRVLEALKRTGQFENTLIVFLSDNGASPERPTRPGYDRTATTRDGEPLLYRGADPPLNIIGSERSYLGIGPAWANAANTPFKFWKMESYEGGANTPCIIHWPAGLSAKSGSITNVPAHVLDLMPTALELVGRPSPERLDGRSLASFIRNGTPRGPEAYYFEHANGRAVRKDGWKLVSRTQSPGQWELYDTMNDVTETNDLADQHPDKVDALRRDWQTWADRVGAESH
jgi:arylsulfatase